MVMTVPVNGNVSSPLDALVGRARAGDMAAFDGLMQAVEERVVSIAWRMLGTKDQAQDAAQEVFLRMFRHLATYRTGSDFRSWVSGITVNVCRDLMRKRGSAASLDEEREAGRLPEPSAPPATEEDLLAGERWSAVARALQTLPPNERAAIVLRDLEGLPTEEVARILGSSPTTVRSQISTGRAKVRAFCDRFFGGMR